MDSSSPTTPETVENDHDNLYNQTMQAVQMPAPEALVNTLKLQMNRIKEKVLHNNLAVDHCLPVLEQNPTLMDVLVVCYILNGGVLLRHMLEEEAEDDKDDELSLDEAFLAELDWKT